jgi:hypothetical protein
MSIGTFGPLTFETSEKRIRTFDAFKRKTQSKWEEHNIIGLKAKTEFVAPGLDDISFQVVFSAYLGLSPLKEIDQLREINQKGEYHPLIIGGKTLGKFVIESVSEAWNHVDNKGNLLDAAVDISLKEYIESASKSGAVSTVSAAATAAKASALASKITSQAKGIGLSPAAISGLAKTAIAAIKDPVSALAGATGILGNIKGLQNVSTYLGTVKNKDYIGAVSSIMGGKAESYQLLGLNVRDIVALAKADPQTAITTILTKVSTGGEPAYTAAKDLFGDQAAAPAVLLSKRVTELAQAFKGG